MRTLQQGTRLGGRYTLGERIASGGMGDVHEAQDDVLERVVAVKILRPDASEEEVFARRFRSEALYTANLCHANIATVFDYGEEDSLAYLVMELVPGEPLSALVRREGPLDPSRVRSIVGQAALALGAAHEAGVVHRDVKPANILITPDGTVKLTDFGIARAVDGSGETLTGEVLGTPHYLSPEQALGESATGASDLYALGIVAHEMLTGRRPFDKNTPVATALAQVNEPPPPLPPHVPAQLRALIEQCLEKKPQDRPESARELGERLGLPDADLSVGSPTAASEVVGAAEAADDAVDDRPAAPRWDPDAVDPTPTPTQAQIAEATRGRVHWMWVPAASIVAMVAAVVLAFSVAR